MREKKRETRTKRETKAEGEEDRKGKRKRKAGRETRNNDIVEQKLLCVQKGYGSLCCKINDLEIVHIRASMM